MPAPNEIPRGYYFALPRLMARLRGTPAVRSEQNWLEAMVAGALVHVIIFLFAAHLLLSGRAAWQQLLLLVPVALLVLVFWSVLMYANALVITLARTAGFLRDRADRHLQSVLIGIATTFAAWQLISAGSWMRLLGLTWIAVVALNLAAAAVLALMHAEPGP